MRPLVVLSCRSLSQCPPDVFLGSSLPFVSSSRLFHTPLAPKPRCGSVVCCYLFARNLSRRVRSRQLNSCELDVTPMGDATSTTRPDLSAWRRDTHTNNKATKPPYKSQHWGTNSLAGRGCTVRSRSCSKQECTTIVHMTRMSHDSSPENQNSILIITDYNQPYKLRSKPKSLKYL